MMPAEGSQKDIELDTTAYLVQKCIKVCINKKNLLKNHNLYKLIERLFTNLIVYNSVKVKESINTLINLSTVD